MDGSCYLHSRIDSLCHLTSRLFDPASNTDHRLWNINGDQHDAHLNVSSLWQSGAGCDTSGKWHRLDWFRNRNGIDWHDRNYLSRFVANRSALCYPRCNNSLPAEPECNHRRTRSRCSRTSRWRAFTQILDLMAWLYSLHLK